MNGNDGCALSSLAARRGETDSRPTGRMTQRIDLWFTCGSTYAALTLCRLSQVEEQTGAAFNLRPFYLADILTELGSWPFAEGSPKTAYMWRDIERRAEGLGMAPKVPLPYPAPRSALANQVAFLALRHDWGRRYLAVAARAWLEQGLAPGSTESLEAGLAAVGQDVDVLLGEIERQDVHRSLLAETREARRLGVFGSPTCVVGDDLFWGDDRIEDAIARSVSADAGAGGAGRAHGVAPARPVAAPPI